MPQHGIALMLGLLFVIFCAGFRVHEESAVSTLYHTSSVSIAVKASWGDCGVDFTWLKSR
jgi:hypothetical protein